MQATEAMFMIISALAFFGSLFGIYYLRTRANLAMIEKGLHPKAMVSQPKPFANLKYGLLFFGAGLGLITGYLIDTQALGHKVISETYVTDSTGRIVPGSVRNVTSNNDHGISMSATSLADGYGSHESIRDQREPIIYFSFVAIGAGLGLMLSYRIEKKQWLDKRVEEREAPAV
ncbi:MAG: hypothetical protein EOP56_12065 [Sphingobacteriales bacterium]|nr:MAG: hypothetical protein EOP56_12065 [Sphingobacteriales bacterium]